LHAVGGTNPVWLFLVLALLPLLGVPASPLIIAIGIRLGAGLGLAFVAAAYLINFTLGYWLARSWFRAPLGRWLERRGRQIPLLSSADETQFILLVRITPGTPLFIQTYVLGLAGVNFARFLGFSLLIQMFYAGAFLYFGQSMHNKAVWHAVLAVALLIGLGLAVNLLRHHMKTRKNIR